MLLDLRSCSEAGRPERLLAAYEDLPIGQALHLISDAPQQGQLHLLQQRHGGELEWYPLLEGPEQWQTLVIRGRPIVSHDRRVVQFMEADHRRIFVLLEQMELTAASAERSEIGTLATHLVTGLKKHIRMEEEVLLPLIAMQLGSPRGPAAVLREDHIRVLDLLEQVQRAANHAEDAPREQGHPALKPLKELKLLLIHHAGMEERILYALADLLLKDEERSLLIQRCQAI